MRAEETAKDLEKRAKLHELRVEQANKRMQAIEAEEKERCKKTAALLKDLEKNSCQVPFFESLMEIMQNFQGTNETHYFFSKLLITL